MAKTAPPGKISIPGVEEPFITNAVPDAFDERDLEYRPRLQPLLPVLDQRDKAKEYFVLIQKGSSCTGHAVAAVINTIQAQTIRRDPKFKPTKGSKTSWKEDAAKLPKVSPYMLYRLARRYDEFEGEEDAGSSLRGAFKGWFNHGVSLADDWPDLDMDCEPDLDDPQFISKCRERPLGAFYRVNPYRLDDMQSAISELNAIAVSSVIHDGWIKPMLMRNARGQQIRVIRRSVNASVLGGHAYALVGYNEIGFLVQNSWGPTWGKGGFATLPYEDWLDTAYDAWVARPGVPQTPFYSGRNRSTLGTKGGLGTAPGPDLKRLAVHVVNLGNDGRLSERGKFRSSPLQIDKAFDHMERWHDLWREQDSKLKRHIMIYAHGGLNDETSALKMAQSQLNWWLNNRIYPLFFAWQTGAPDTILNQLVDTIKDRLPVGGIGFDLVEQFDRLVEKFARASFRWAWDEMKENARRASDPISNPDQVIWPASNGAEKAMARMPGASLVVTRLARYIESHGAENVALHLVGHSAGSIFHAAFLQRLAAAGIKVDSMALLAPGIRIDEFRTDIYPHLGKNKTVARFSVFDLTDRRELDDVCGANGINIYHKSLLYLVSRALERSKDGNPAEAFEIPLLGLHKFFDEPFIPGSSVTLQQAIEAAGGAAIFSRSAAPADCRSDATSHGAFDNDSPTMTSVVMRALGLKTPIAENDFQENAALRDSDHAPSLDGRPPVAQPAAQPAAARAEEVAAEPLMTAAGASAPGDAALTETAEPQTETPVAPQPVKGLPVEIAVAPRTGSSIQDVLESVGWTVEDEPPDKPKQKRRSRK